MSKNLFPAVIISALSLLVLVSCNKPKQEVPVIKLNMTETTVEAAGNSLSVAFEIVNPVEGVALQVAAAQDCDWVSGLVVSEGTKGTVEFTVAKNKETQTRQSELTFSYEGAQPVVFVINQSAAEELPITINVKDVQATSFIADIILKDKDMRFLSFIAKEEELASFADDEALYQDDKAYMEMLAEYYAMDIDEVWGEYTVVGDQLDLAYSGLNPETAYIVYAYGVDSEKDWARLTDITREAVSTPALPMIDASFSLKVSVDGVNVAVEATPSIDGPYILDVYTVESAEEEELSLEEFVGVNWMSLVNIYMMFGFTPDDILGEFAFSGKATYNPANIMPNTKYFAAAFAVDPATAYQYSKPEVYEFTSDDVKPSDMTFEIEVSEVGSRSAHIKVTPSNDDYYALIFYDDVEFPTTGDQDIIDHILENFNIGAVQGVYEGTASSLHPETTYAVHCFGYAGGQATTGLFSKKFTTEVDIPSDVKITCGIDSYCPTASVIALDPTWSDFSQNDVFADVKVNILEGGEVSEYYFGVFSYEDVEANEPDVFADYLLYQGASASGAEAIYILYYGDEVAVAALVKDTEGRYSDIVISDKIVITEEGATGDPQAILDVMNALYGGSAAPANGFAPSVMKHIQEIASPLSVKNAQPRVFKTREKRIEEIDLSSMKSDSLRRNMIKK